MLLCYDMLYMYVCLTVHVRTNIGGRGWGVEGGVMFDPVFFFPLFNIYIIILIIIISKPLVPTDLPLPLPSHSLSYASAVCMYVCMKKELYYLTTHSTHFIHGYMTSDIW